MSRSRVRIHWLGPADLCPDASGTETLRPGDEGWMWEDLVASYLERGAVRLLDAVEPEPDPIEEPKAEPKAKSKRGGK